MSPHFAVWMRILWVTTLLGLLVVQHFAYRESRKLSDALSNLINAQDKQIAAQKRLIEAQQKVIDAHGAGNEVPREKDADPKASVTHMPASGKCPEKWKTEPQFFTEADGSYQDACLDPDANEMTIDTLRPGESFGMGFAVPWRSEPEPKPGQGRGKS